MATSTPPEREGKQNRTGSRLLLLSLVLAVIGAAVAIPFEGTAAGVGVTILFFACLPFVAGPALMGAAFVSKRSRAGKPFA